LILNIVYYLEFVIWDFTDSDMSFTHREIKSNTIGGFLKQARLTQGWEIIEAARKTGIEAKYLEFLEADDFYKLPSSTYARGFLKRYAEFLKQDAGELLKQWDLKYHHRGNDFPKEKIKKGNMVPKVNPKAALVGLLILLVFLYFAWNAKKVLFAPGIRLISPVQDTVVRERSLVIQGRTDPRADVFVNDQSVAELDAGIFRQRIDLLPGLNTIEISAQKKYSKKSVIYLRVVLEEQEEVRELE